MNLLKLANLEDVERFLDFSSVPSHADYFPLDEAHKEELDRFYQRIPLKTRVVCPLPQTDSMRPEKI